MSFVQLSNFQNTISFQSTNEIEKSEDNGNNNNDDDDLLNDLDIELIQSDQELSNILNSKLNLNSTDFLINSLTKCSNDLKYLESETISQFLSHTPKLTTLHLSLEKCDNLLIEMEIFLKKFQIQLGSISTEIFELQQKSQQMNIQLKNRKNLQNKLNNYIDQILITDEMCKILMEGDLDSKLNSSLSPATSILTSTTALSNNQTNSDKKQLLSNNKQSFDDNSHHSFSHYLSILDQRLNSLSLLVEPSLVINNVNNSNNNITNYQQQPPHQKQSKSIPVYRSLLDLLPLLDSLKLRTLQRIYEFLISKIQQFRQPKINIQIQQQSMLKFKNYYAFLRKYTAGQSQIISSSNLQNSDVIERDRYGMTIIPSNLSIDIKNIYQETMSILYCSKFKKYLSEMKKLQSEINKNIELLGANLYFESTTQTVLNGLTLIGQGIFGSTNNQLLKNNYSSIARARSHFQLGGREAILNANINENKPSNLSNESLIIPHIALQQGQRLPFEKIFKSGIQLLMDTATSEIQFENEFFQENLYNSKIEQNSLADSDCEFSQSKSSKLTIDQIQLIKQNSERRHKDLFSMIFASTFPLFFDQLNDYLIQCTDSLSILILIRLVCQHNLTMQHRNLSCLDNLFDRFNMMLWPKFKQHFDAQVESIQKTQSTHNLTIQSSKQDNSPELISVLRQPSLITLKYADFVTSILLLNVHYSDEILILNLRRLRTELEKLLMRSASRFSLPRLQLVYLINQSHSILNILISNNEVNSNQSTNENEELNNWRQFERSKIEMFIEEELYDKFQQLITVVKQTEVQLNNQHYNNSNNINDKVSTLVSKSATSINDQSSVDQTQFNSDAPSPPIDFISLETSASHFNKYWKNGIEAIVQTCQRYFGSENLNFKNNENNEKLYNSNFYSMQFAQSSHDLNSTIPSFADELIKQTLVQFVLYYQRFQELIKKLCKEKPQIVKEIVPISTVLFEIKKYNSNAQPK